MDEENYNFGKRTKLQKLSKDFSAHCGQDLAKKCILLPKFVLQCLNVWPDNDSFARRLLMIICIINCTLMACAHLGYVIANIPQISKMCSACTTVSTTFEGVAKLATLLYYRDPLNKILHIIWHEFWPAGIVCAKRRNEIRSRSAYVTIVGSSFLIMAYLSCAQFMAYPLINNVDELPCASVYPFDFRKSPLYEMMYIWQWFSNQIVIATLSGFDAFFNSIVMICSTQFQILQDVLENICSDKAKMQLEICQNNKNIRYVDEIDVMVKIVQHHLKLTNLCKMVEKTFKHIVFLQFCASTLAICVSMVGLIADPTLWEHMLSYLVAHMFQFFIYCSVGNELTYQSVCVADAAYNCNWEVSDNLELRKGLIMIIRRAQKPQSLTVAGLMQLSFSNFISTVQLSFSFYALLSSFV